jgi:hypothetical protein
MLDTHARTQENPPCGIPLLRDMKLLTPLLCILAATRLSAADASDFSRDVRPILSQHCFKCHGPDDKARKGGLRLDIRESAVKEAKSGGIALVPGKPGESELITRIFSTDEDELMPPPSAKRPLTLEQKDILRRWVAAGAEYRQHWAFVRPKQTAVPTIADCGLRIADWKKREPSRAAEISRQEPAILHWPRNAIDAFVLDRLLTAGLPPSPEADPAILCRRLYLDLMGIPPTPAEQDDFIQSAIRNPQSAIESLADKLLASPHYGERWARRWLDLARYADTNGYEKDRPRSIWPYRDWVINALNADKPFDQFTVEQIAGDMLHGATLEQRIATGFHRNTMLNEEGGIDPNEFRFHAMTDRVATTGVTWLGLTLGCAQCHTHKFDPITHRAYYQLMAFMNNADEPDVDIPQPDAEEQRKKNAALAEKLLAELPEKWATKPPMKPGGQPAPKPTGKGAAKRAKPEVAEVAAANAAKEDAAQAPAPSPDSTPAPKPSLDEKFAEWLARERERTVAWQPLRPASAKSNLPLLTIEGDASVFASGDISKADTYELHFHDVPAGVTAIQLEALPDPRLPAHGPGMAFYEGPKGDFFIGEVQLSADGQPVKLAGATESYAKNNFGKNPATAAFMLDGDPQTGWSTAGRMGERHTAVLTLPSPAPAARDWTLKLVMGRHYACSIGRFRVSVTTDTRPVVARDLPEEMETLLALPDAKLTAAQRARLREEFLLSLPELSDEAARIRSLRKRAQPPITLGFRERPPENPRPTFIHNRGEYLQPTDPVTPGIPSFLNPLAADAKRDRLTFARWLVSPENPLTARVTVNRQWAAFFGRGLVKTTEDFGYQGEAPTHPELLDWLAVEFVKQGWSLKKLHRLIVTSATYRQSSRVRNQESAGRSQGAENSPGASLIPDSRPLTPDPDNRLLSRFPRVRLEAEIIRDAALAASGLLTDKIGGPSVHPPQPDGVTEAAYGGGSWTPSTGPDRYRRSLYTFSKRTAPFALYNTFDGPTGEACIARRDMSNTPLQALSLLNDVVFAEAAQAFGKQLVERNAGDGERLDEAFRRIVCRNPSPEERTTLLRFLETQRERLAGAKPSADVAAWTALVRALFSLDEVVTKG